MSKIHDIDNYYLAPLAPRCIQQKPFLPPVNPSFPCWDIREGELEKTIGYAQALLYWAENAILLTPGQPHLLARYILELRKAMESYMPFSDDAILDGATSPEGSLEDVTRVTVPRGASLTSASTPTKEEPAEGPPPLEVVTKEASPRKPHMGPTHLPVAVDDSTEGLTAPKAQHKEQRKLEAPHSGYPGCTDVLHPPQPVTTAEPIPQPVVNQRGDTAAGAQGESSASKSGRKPTNHGKSPKLAQEIALPLTSWGGSLLTEGSLTHGHHQSTHEAYANRYTGGTCDSYNVH